MLHMIEHAVVLPHRYALGDVVYCFCRRVNVIQAKRITMCCQPERRVLYPNATDFVDVPQHLTANQMDITTKWCRLQWPHAKFYEQSRASLPPEKPLLIQPPLIIAPRYKPVEWAKAWPHRNWDGWPKLCDMLMERGHNVVSVGKPEMSYPVNCPKISDLTAIFYAIQCSPLIIATDSAFAHMGILLRRPTAVLWGSPAGVIPGQTYDQGAHKAMERQKIAPVYHLEGAWESAEKAMELLEPLLPKIDRPAEPQ